MKRSEINQNIQKAKDAFDKQGFKLPRWGYWAPDEWKKVGPEAREIRESMLGWDITDFGSNDFYKVGLTLFTVRNGNLAQQGNLKTYGEKIMLVQVDQITPMHFHWDKMEDIINRGGGELVIQLYNATAEEDLDTESDVKVSIDGITHTVKAGDTIRLAPGDSVTLPPYQYHKFWAEKADCVVGEVSKTNDDTKDNRFHEPIGRFPAIEEDEPPMHLLCNEYPQF